jgi:hypothetical protein
MEFEKVRRHPGHIRGVAEEAANLFSVEVEERASAAVVRGRDMVA